MLEIDYTAVDVTVSVVFGAFVSTASNRREMSSSFSHSLGSLPNLGTGGGTHQSLEILRDSQEKCCMRIVNCTTTYVEFLKKNEQVKIEKPPQKADFTMVATMIKWPIC